MKAKFRERVLSCSRGQMTVYKSFWQTVRLIADAGERVKAYDAIFDYGFLGEMPNLDRLPATALMAFLGAKPNIEASRKKAESGSKHGKSWGNAQNSEGESEEFARRHPKQTRNKRQTNREQTQTEGETPAQQSPKENEKEVEIEAEIEKEKEKEIEEESPSGRPEGAGLSAQFSLALVHTLQDWLEYKAEKRQAYGPTALEALREQVARRSREVGEKSVIRDIRHSMASNYAGIVWSGRGQVPMGATGHLGDAELLAIRQMMQEE